MHAAIRAGSNEAQAAGRLLLLQVSRIWARRTPRRRGGAEEEGEGRARGEGGREEGVETEGVVGLGAGGSGVEKGGRRRLQRGAEEGD